MINLYDCNLQLGKQIENCTLLINDVLMFLLANGQNECMKGRCLIHALSQKSEKHIRSNSDENILNLMYRRGPKNIQKNEKIVKLVGAHFFYRFELRNQSFLTFSQWCTTYCCCKLTTDTEWFLNRGGRPPEIFRISFHLGGECLCSQYLLSDESWRIQLMQKNNRDGLVWGIVLRYWCQMLVMLLMPNHEGTQQRWTDEIIQIIAPSTICLLGFKSRKLCNHAKIPM